VAKGVAGKIITAFIERRRASPSRGEARPHVARRGARLLQSSTGSGRSYREPLRVSWTQGPCIPMVLEGDDAIQRWRDLMGATESRQGRPGDDFGKDFASSIEAKPRLHGSGLSGLGGRSRLPTSSRASSSAPVRSRHVRRAARRPGALRRRAATGWPPTTAGSGLSPDRPAEFVERPPEPPRYTRAGRKRPMMRVGTAGGSAWCSQTLKYELNRRDRRRHHQSSRKRTNAISMEMRGDFSPPCPTSSTRTRPSGWWCSRARAKNVWRGR